MNPMPRFGGAILWALAGAVAFYASPLMPSNPPVTYSEVVVPARVIEESEPDTVVTWRERIVTRVVEPDQVAQADSAGEPEVASFCAEFAQERVDSAVAEAGDTVEVAASPPPRRLLLRSGSHHPGWLWRSDQIMLTGPTSDGDLQQSSYTLRPGFSFRASGDSVIVRSPRFWWVRELLETGAVIGVWELGKLVF